MKCLSIFTLALIGCGREEIKFNGANPPPTTNPPPAAITPAATKLIVGTVVDSLELDLSLSVSPNGTAYLSALEPSTLDASPLLTVPASTSLTVYSFLDSTAGDTLQTEDFGYFNVKVKNNSSAIWNKSDIYLSVRFSSAGNTFQTVSGDVLTTQIMKPVNGGEGELLSTIPTCGTAGCGVRAFTYCNATAGSCPSKPSINTQFQDIRILGNFNVPAGTYNGTLTFDLVVSP